MTTIDAPTSTDPTDPTQPRPIRDSLLPATLSLLAVLALLTGAAVALGVIVRVIASYVLS